MSVIKPFKAIRPSKELAKTIAALPYDVYNTKEARAIVVKNPKSFLKIDRPEVLFEDEVDPHSEIVYKKAGEVLEEMIDEGDFVQETEEALYIYELTMDGHSHTGIVACASVDEYMSGDIKKHEKTRAEKEEDRVNHVDYLDAHTGPIFLTYAAKDQVDSIVGEWCNSKDAIYDFIAEDGVKHKVWCIDDLKTIERLKVLFEEVKAMYIADGHHRAASAVRVAKKRRHADGDYVGDEAYNYFLSVIFPDNQLTVMDYNRVVKDLNDLSIEAFLEAISEQFEIIKEDSRIIKPADKGTFGMYLDHKWYLLEARSGSYDAFDPVKSLDVSILQSNLLKPILNIGDPRTDERIDFIGGIRGLEEIEKRCKEDMVVGFAMYPTSVKELMAIADVGELMPPKSTWFEPKLRSGLFIHKLN